MHRRRGPSRHAQARRSHLSRPSACSTSTRNLADRTSDSLRPARQLWRSATATARILPGPVYPNGVDSIDDLQSGRHTDGRNLTKGAADRLLLQTTTEDFTPGNTSGMTRCSESQVHSGRRRGPPTKMDVSLDDEAIDGEQSFIPTIRPWDIAIETISLATMFARSASAITTGMRPGYRISRIIDQLPQHSVPSAYDDSPPDRLARDRRQAGHARS